MRGTVVASGHSSSYGNYITIKHTHTYTIVDGYKEGGEKIIKEKTDVYYTFYAHLKESLVDVGDRVNMGQNIAEVGTTGNAKGLTGDNIHLHFEIGTDLRATGSPFLMKSKLLDANVAYSKVRFSSANPEANQSVTGVIKTDILGAGAIIETLQKYNNTVRVGADKVLRNTAVDLLNEAGGVNSSSSSECPTCPITN